MHQSLPLITTITMAFGLAFIMGLLVVRLKLPALVGYLLAGIIIGPFTPGLNANVKIAQELAEIGVMLLMFGVGLHFSLADLMRVRRIAIPGAIVQMVAATMLGICAALMWKWHFGAALIFGLALSVASTIVLLRALIEKGTLETINGHIAVGWLLVEDLAMVVVLVILPPLAPSLGANHALNLQNPLWMILGITFLKVTCFIGLMLIVGRRLFPRLLWYVAHTGSRELFTLAVITAAIGIAYGAATFFGVSFALGAFFAGMILRESTFSHRAAEESLPLRDAFAVLFFVAVGMLFNPKILIEHPFQVFSVVGIIVIGKSIAAFILVLLFRYPLKSALIVSASLAQIGEFSFILAELGVRLGILPVAGRDLILAGSLISISINPFLFKLIKPLHRKLDPFVRAGDNLKDITPISHEKFLTGQVVIIGYGPLGKRITDLLNEKSLSYIVVADNRELIASLKEQKIHAVYGNAQDPSLLIQSHIARAGMLIILETSSMPIRKLIQFARKINSGMELIIWSSDEEETAILQKIIRGKVFFVEEEMAKNMGDYVLERYGKT